MFLAIRYQQVIWANIEKNSHVLLFLGSISTSGVVEGGRAAENKQNELNILEVR